MGRRKRKWKKRKSLKSKFQIRIIDKTEIDENTVSPLLYLRL